MFSFSKKFRLSDSKIFFNIFKNSKRNSFSGICIAGKLNKFKNSRLGLVFSKKEIKDACKRNRIKRLIREYFRLHQFEFQKMDFIVSVKKESVCLDNKRIVKILKRLWNFYRY